MLFEETTMAAFWFCVWQTLLDATRHPPLFLGLRSVWYCSWRKTASGTSMGAQRRGGLCSSRTTADSLAMKAHWRLQTQHQGCQCEIWAAAVTLQGEAGRPLAWEAWEGREEELLGRWSCLATAHSQRAAPCTLQTGRILSDQTTVPGSEMQFPIYSLWWGPMWNNMKVQHRHAKRTQHARNRSLTTSRQGSTALTISPHAVLWLAVNGPLQLLLCWVTLHSSQSHYL